MIKYHIEIKNTDKNEPREIDAENPYKAAKIYWKNLGFKGSVVVRCSSETGIYSGTSGTFTYYRKGSNRKRIGPDVLIRW